MPVGSLFGYDDARSDVTGSIGRANTAAPVPAAATAAAPAEADLALARAAAAEILARGGKDASAPWENPKTGARGTITPIAQAYDQDGMVCRDFLASYVKPDTETWLQGEACQMGKGRWQVRSLKPWKRT